MSSDAQDLAARLDRIQRLTSDLAKVRDDLVKQQAIADRITQELHAVRVTLRLAKP
jgi:outer membrane murein-binding lipoprotein Lpp